MTDGAGQDATLAAVAAGVDAIVVTASRVVPTGPTACAAWTVHDLVRHLEAIAGAYLLWAGAAIGGRVGSLRTPEQLRAYNDEMLRRLPDLSTSDHLERFRALARDHGRLVRAGWDMPMMTTSADVVLRLGDHARVAALEWHVHAWDLGLSAEERHRPSTATLEVLTVARDTLADVIAVTRDVRDDPWDALLEATGRTPT